MANTIIAALSYVWKALAVLNAPMAVAGGIAVGLWKIPRATRDVDLLIAVEPPALENLYGVLGAAGLLPRTTPFPLDLGGLRVALLNYRPPESFFALHIDLLFADTEYHRLALDRAITAVLPETSLEVKVLACEDLIVMKLLAGRMLDQVDVISLLQANSQEIDRAYLAQWSNRLQLKAEFAELWTRALPNEIIPQ